MDVFNHLIPFVAIILGVGLADLLFSLHRLMRNRARIRWHVLPLIWAALAFFATLQNWWAFYYTGQLEALSYFFTFAFHLLGPVLLFLLCAAVLPDITQHDAKKKLDLLAFHLKQRRYLFGLASLYVLHGALNVGVQHGFWLDPLQLYLFALSVVLVSLAIIAKKIYHVVITTLFVILFIGYVAWFNLNL